jgi:peroxiredoxin
MAESLLCDRTVVPNFHLQGRGGVIFDSSDLKKKNCILFFVTSPSPSFFLMLEEAQEALGRENAACVVVCLLSPAQIDDLHRKHRLSYFILSDQNRELFSKFIISKTLENFAAFFMLDKTPQIYFQGIVGDCSHLPPMPELVKGLNFIESQYSKEGENL